MSDPETPSTYAAGFAAPSPVATLKSLQEAVESLKRQLELSKSERAHWIEKSQAQDAELRKLRDKLAAAELLVKATETRAKDREEELQRELEQALHRERTLRTKFEEELRKLQRVRAASEAELRESMALKEKELGSALAYQQEQAASGRHERRRLEELVAGYHGEIGRLRAVLQAVDEKLSREAAVREAEGRERRALEELVHGLLGQNSRLQSSLDAVLQGKDVTMGERREELEGFLGKFRGEVGALEARLADQTQRCERLLQEAEALRKEAADQSKRRLQAQEEAARARLQLEDASRRLKASEEAAGAERARAEAESRRQEASRTSLEARIAELESAVSQAEAEREKALADQKTDFEERLGELKSELARARRQLAEAEEWAARPWWRKLGGRRPAE